MPNTNPDLPAVPPNHALFKAVAGKRGPHQAATEHAADAQTLRTAIATLAGRSPAGALPELQSLLQALDQQVAATLQDEPTGPALLTHWGTFRQLCKGFAEQVSRDSWQSPPVSESGPPQKAPHQDPVLPFQNDYQRYALPLQREEAALDGLHDPIVGTRQRTWLFSSGMSAFATLLRALRPVPEAVRLTGQHLYFESAKLLATDHPRTVTVDERDPQGVAAAIAAHQSEQVFLDPVANSSELPTLNFRRVVKALAALPESRTRWLVMDTTLLGAAFQPAKWLDGMSWPANLQLITYRSLQKLDQLGLDLVTGGAVTAWVTQPFALEALRQLCGSLPTEQALLLLPLPERGAWLAKLTRHERNVQALANFLTGLRSPWLGAVRLADRRQLDGHCGPLFWAEWADPLSGEDAHRFLLHMVQVARNRGVPVAYGTSFGFLTTRVAAFTRSRGQGTSLRIAPGTENLAQLARVADVWQEALASFGTVLAGAYRTDPTSEWGKVKRFVQAAITERAWSPEALQRLSLGLDGLEPLVTRVALSPDLQPLQAELQATVVEPLRIWLGELEPGQLAHQGSAVLEALSGLTERLARLEDRLKPPSWWRRLLP